MTTSVICSVIGMLEQWSRQRSCKHSIQTEKAFGYSISYRNVITAASDTE